MSERIGMSLHIGVNYLDPAGYPMEPPSLKWPKGWDGYLEGCHSDAEAMCEIAQMNNFDSTLLLSEDATADRVKREVKRAADRLNAGDIFFLSFAGHGGQVPDVSKDEGFDEWGDVDQWDETWCLYDRHFIDDEQQVMYTDFKPGVRILVVSDSCHSGTVNRSADDDHVSRPIRAMTRETAHACYLPRKDEYDNLQLSLKKVDPEDVKANFLLIAACTEDETAGDGSPHGVFTQAVLNAWDGGRFRGTYRQLHQLVLEELEDRFDRDQDRYRGREIKYPPEHQTPRFNEGESRDPSFYDERPFSI